VIRVASNAHAFAWPRSSARQSGTRRAARGPLTLPNILHFRSASAPAVDQDDFVTLRGHRLVLVVARPVFPLITPTNTEPAADLPEVAESQCRDLPPDPQGGPRARVDRSVGREQSLPRFSLGPRTAPVGPPSPTTSRPGPRDRPVPIVSPSLFRRGLAATMRPLAVRQLT